MKTNKERSKSADEVGAVAMDDLLVEIRKQADRAMGLDKVSRQAGRDAVAAAIRVGELLHTCKEAVGHGKWTAWREENLPEISTETACRWMRLAKLSQVTDLGEIENLTEAYRLCETLAGAPSEPSAPDDKQNPAPTGQQRLLQASTTLQKRLRLVVQKGEGLSKDDENQLRLLWAELSQLFKQLFQGAQQ